MSTHLYFCRLLSNELIRPKKTNQPKLFVFCFLLLLFLPSSSVASEKKTFCRPRNFVDYRSINFVCWVNVTKVGSLQHHQWQQQHHHRHHRCRPICTNTFASAFLRNVVLLCGLIKVLGY
jgi:hypothetical protein